MLQFFGARPSKAAAYSARTYGELAAVLEDEVFQTNGKIQLLEVFLDKSDSPWMLSGQINIVHGKSGKQMVAWDKECDRQRKPLDGNLWSSEYKLHANPSNLYLESREATGKK
jgi:hypothetical protein